jgi:hypothetical protein
MDSTRFLETLEEFSRGHAESVRGPLFLDHRLVILGNQGSIEHETPPLNHEQLAEQVRIPERWSDISGFFDFESLYQHIVDSAPSGARLCEVGSYVGRSVCMLGALAKERNAGLSVVAVDHCRGSTSDDTGQGLALTLGGSYAGILARNIERCGLAGIISVVAQQSTIAAGLFPDEWFHFVFIDGDHQRESVRADIEAWWPKVKNGGILAGHDYVHSAFPGVAEAVREVFGPGDYQDTRSGSCWSVKKPKRKGKPHAQPQAPLAPASC